ncbi:hypothetical protein [Labrys okinawensis]|nr:hypothetical protein [Labrys okinawensis]
MLKLIGEFRALPLLKFLEALRLLHASETAEAADFSITATGRQFAWQYEYRTPYEEKQAGACIVTGPLAVPLGQSVDVMVTSEDVIHEWSVPALGIEVDGIPGRLNVARLDTSRPGRFMGGATKTSGKGFEAMTIEVKVMQPEAYAGWVRENLEAKGMCQAGPRGLSLTVVMFTVDFA